MNVTPMLDPRIHATKARLRDLESLRRRIEAEIADTQGRLSELVEGRRQRRSRRNPAPCGTAPGYQRHRYQWRVKGEGVWPLPADDPCGCRAAHNAAQRINELLKGTAA